MPETCLSGQVPGKLKKDVFKIRHFFPVKLDPFVFEHFYFFLYGRSRCLSLKSPDPTGCGDNPVSGDFGRIRIFSHGLAHPPICFCSQGMGNFFIGRYAPFGHRPQKIVHFIGKGFHCIPQYACRHLTLSALFHELIEVASAFFVAISSLSAFLNNFRVCHRYVLLPMFDI
jgi:hypothetical protein